MPNYLDWERATVRSSLAQWTAGVTKWVANAWLRAGKKVEFSEFSASERACLYDLTVAPCALKVDRQTWDDMLLSPYHSAVSGQSSIFSQQVLYCRLRGGVDASARLFHAQRIASLLSDAPLRTVLQAALHRLRASNTEIATALFAADTYEAVPAWWPIAKWLPHGVFVLLGVGTVLHTFSAVALTAYVAAAILLFLQFLVRLEFDRPLACWADAMKSLRNLLLTAVDLSRSELPLVRELNPSLLRADRLRRALARLALADPLLSVRDILDWYTLARERHYIHQRRYIKENSVLFQEVFYACAHLEADAALATHLTNSGSHCWPDSAPGQRLTLNAARHPLLTSAQPLDVSTQDKGLFISGQNGIGKSTLLRTIGINVIAANSFGFCYAASASIPPLPVFSSMQNEDSLLQGESLYISELRRARELSRVANDIGPALFLIDEIFRGTNYLESVSAAAAFLNAISHHGMVFVSSHNLILASILAKRLDAVVVTKQGPQGALSLSAGILKETNGISLLASHGFDDKIEKDARLVHLWLSDYITSPRGGCPIALH